MMTKTISLVDMHQIDYGDCDRLRHECCSVRSSGIFVVIFISIVIRILSFISIFIFLILSIFIPIPISRVLGP